MTKVEIYKAGDRFCYRFLLRSGNWKTSNGTWATAAYTRKVLLKQGYKDSEIGEAA